jgi:hypothetical protein
MSLLGFDTIGRWALGELPHGNLALLTNAGAFAGGGLATPFTISAAGGVGTFAFAGVTGSFTVREAGALYAFSLTGVAEAFTVAEAESAGGFVLVLGIAAADLIGTPAPPAVGFAAAGLPVPYRMTYATAPGSCTLAGVAATLTRDFINWLPLTFEADNWGMETAPGSNWSAAGPPPASWTNSSTPSPAWSQVPRPSGAWTVDPAQTIPPPVSD